MYTHPIWEELKSKAKKKQARVVLCEALDERVLRAADVITREKLAQICLIGNEKNIKEKIKSLGINNSAFEYMDPSCAKNTNAIAQRIFERRKSKGMSEKEAEILSKQEFCFGFGITALGLADAVVAGAVASTAETVKSAMYCLGTLPGHKIITGLFLVETPYARHYGLQGGFVFADCGVTPDPSSRMLAHIAQEASQAFTFYYNAEPRVAFLSFSTLGSASHERVDRVTDAVKTAKKQYPKLIIEGELQLDSALDAEIASRKGVHNSPVAGKANVLIFPDLDSGNITYKAVQRFGNARTIGPILWGMEKPVSDLSRGCSIDDIVYSVCAVSVQC